MSDPKYVDIIYPTIKKKYKGSISELDNGHFRLTYSSKSKTYPTYNEAFKALIDINIEQKTVKNIIYDTGNYLMVNLQEGLNMKFDKQDLDLVQSTLVWGVKKGNAWYAVMKYKDTYMYFHNYPFLSELVKHKDYTVDHINHDPLDNRRENLRLVGKSTQSFNRGLHSHNKSGLNGVFFVKKAGKEYWVAKWFVNGVQHQKYFNTKKYSNAKELAQEHRAKMEQQYFI